MLDLLPPVDWVGDAKAYMTKAVEMFARYPDDVMMSAALLIPERMKRPYVADIKFVLDELYETVLAANRDEERQLARQRALASLQPPRQPRTPEEQAKVDEQVVAWRKRHGIPPDGLPPKGAQAPPLEPYDPEAQRRVFADCERRRAIKEQRRETQP